ncbi:TMV resistance protein N-like [Senna tora]|uniref:TMV resistance protein N-like n=1 Tax=Senna tora TaxID=362788 RepID=A0A834WBK7_9FABA|nr:TMV resistance protein N-like [Senna tora]
MQHSKIKQLCKETQFMGNLKFLDLSHCIDLTKLPNFDGIPNLERLVLKGCKSLVEIHQSLGLHKKLMIVNLKHCTSLKALPRKLEMNSLVTFVLSGCSKIRKLPEFGETMERLSTLDLEETSIIRLPESLAFLTGLTTLNLRNCKNLVCLPNVIQNLRSIKIINLSGCSKCEKLSENWNENKAMEELDVSGTAIKEVPSSIFLLENLKFLSFRGCKGTTPRQAWNFPIPFGWKHKLNNPSVSTMLTLPSSSPSLPLLKKLDLSYCNLTDESLPKDLSNFIIIGNFTLKGKQFYTQLLGLIASLNSQTNSNQDYFFLMIQGSEIPSWFHNENDIYVTCPKEETNLSFIADIPDYCCSSEWWGIVVCLVVHEDIASPPFRGRGRAIFFKCYPIEDESPRSYRPGHELDEQYNSSHQLLIFFIPCYYNFHVKKLQLEFCIKPHSQLQPKYTVTKYSWRVLCKEDIEAWLQTKCDGSSSNRRSKTIIDIASNHLDCLNEIRVATEASQKFQQCHEIDVKDAATIDAKQNKENSKH